MTPKPETLRTYAAILDLPSRGHDGMMRGPGEINLAAAEALHFQANYIEENGGGKGVEGKFQIGKVWIHSTKNVDGIPRFSLVEAIAAEDSK